MQTITAPPAAAKLGDADDVRQRIADGYRLISSRQLEAAAMMMWSAFEAAVRLSLDELGRQTDDPIWVSEVPAGLCVQAVAYGVIDPADRDVLLRFLPMIGAASHDSAEAIDVGLLQEVGQFTARTLDEMGQ